MKLREPATFWTDCALAVWSAFLGAALARHAPAPCPPVLGWWIGGFVTSALAAAAGAVHHGLGHALPPAADRTSWRVALLALVGTGLCLTQVAAFTTLTGAGLARAQFAAWLVAGLFAATALRRGTFSVAVCAYGLGQLLVLAAALGARRSHPPADLAWLVAAVATSALAAGVQRAQLGFGPRFNHNDLYHVVQAVAQGCFFLGAWTAG